MSTKSLTSTEVVKVIATPASVPLARMLAVVVHCGALPTVGA